MVVMDISLPNMGGKEATQRLRADTRFIDLPIIAVSAHAIANEREAILASGVSRLLTKPIDIDEICEVANSFRQRGEENGKVARSR